MLWGIPERPSTWASLVCTSAGLIKYSRGHIIVTDRAGLEARACECYAVVKKESDRLLPEYIAPRGA